MTFTPRTWTDKYIVSATDLIDLETRVAAYADSVGGGGSGGGFLLASASGIVPGNTASANKTAFDAVMTSFGSSGGTLFCDWTGEVDVNISSSSIVPTGNVTIVGRGRETKIKCGNVSAAAQCFNWTSGSNIVFTLKDITLEGPSTITGSFLTAGIENDATTGLIRVINSKISKFSHCIRRSGGTTPTNWSCDVLDSDLEGYAGTYVSTCILINTNDPGGNAGFLRVRGGSITNYGDPNLAVLHHGIYSPLDMDNLIDGVTFGGSAVATDSGYAIQLLDHTPFGTTNTNASPHTVITNCLFLTGSSAVSRGITIGALSNHMTKISDCTFLCGGQALLVDGPCQANNCTFTGYADTSSYCVQFATGGSIMATNCKFAHGAGLFTFGVDQTGVTVECDDCEFVQNTGQTGIFSAASGSDATSSIVVRNSIFRGVNGDETIILDSACKVLLDSNVFTATGANPLLYVHTNGTSKTLRLFKNDFSQAGSTVFADSTMPATFDANGNYGSKGDLKSENGGTFTSTPGAVTSLNIAHGLGFTPTVFDARPNNTNARGAPAYSVTATSTNVVLTFASALTTATSYVWNWFARYQA